VRCRFGKFFTVTGSYRFSALVIGNIAAPANSPIAADTNTTGWVSIPELSPFIALIPSESLKTYNLAKPKLNRLQDKLFPPRKRRIHETRTFRIVCLAFEIIRYDRPAISPIMNIYRRHTVAFFSCCLAQHSPSATRIDDMVGLKSLF